MEIGTEYRQRDMLALCRRLNQLRQQWILSQRQYEKDEKQLKKNIASLAHDIRTPLTGAAGYIQLAQECSESARRERYLQTAGGRLKELGDMLEKNNEDMNRGEPVKSETSEEIKDSSEPEPVPFLIRSKTSQKIWITKDEFLIGSEQDSIDCRIDDNPAISRNHAKIVRHEKEYFVVDNDSRNHTYLNGVLVESGEEHYVPHGAMLRFADEDFEFKMHE